MTGQKMGRVGAQRRRLTGGEGAVDEEGGGVEVPPSLSSLSPAALQKAKKRPSAHLGSSPQPATAPTSPFVFWRWVTGEANILVCVKADGEDLIMPGVM